jgi:hypothetical protein
LAPGGWVVLITGASQRRVSTLHSVPTSHSTSAVAQLSPLAARTPQLPQEPMPLLSEHDRLLHWEANAHSSPRIRVPGVTQLGSFSALT